MFKIITGQVKQTFGFCDYHPGCNYRKRTHEKYLVTSKGQLIWCQNPSNKCVHLHITVFFRCCFNEV